LINSNSDMFDIVFGIKKSFCEIKELNIFFYDYSCKKLKDVVNNFSPIEDMFDETAVGFIYNNFLKLSNCDYILDNTDINKAFIYIGIASIIVILLVLMYMKPRFGLKPSEYKKEDIKFEI